MANTLPAAPIAAYPVVIAGPTGPTGPSFVVTGMAAAEPATRTAEQPLDVVSAIVDLTVRVKALEAAFGKR